MPTTPREVTDALSPRLELHGHDISHPLPLDRSVRSDPDTVGGIGDAVADTSSSAAVAPSPLLTDPDRMRKASHNGVSGDQHAEATSSGGGIQWSAAESRLCLAGSPRNINCDEDGPASEPDSSDTRASSISLPYSNTYGIYSPRLTQSSMSCKFRPGTKYRGTQTSDATRRYNVEVDIKTVDMAESFICGYLKIEGLTPEHATLTTFFEGEIIGPKYTFRTRHDTWGATEKDDKKHWGHFPAWKPFAKQAKWADLHYKHPERRENVFMRWKEKFLVPDHRVREILGASFEGFYYICFNQITGVINGIYYHVKADQLHSHNGNSNSINNNNKIQNLELEWVPDQGRIAAHEFR